MNNEENFRDLKDKIHLSLERIHFNENISIENLSEEEKKKLNSVINVTKFILHEKLNSFNVHEYWLNYNNVMISYRTMIKDLEQTFNFIIAKYISFMLHEDQLEQLDFLFDTNKNFIQKLCILHYTNYTYLEGCIAGFLAGGIKVFKKEKEIPIKLYSQPVITTEAFYTAERAEALKYLHKLRDSFEGKHWSKFIPMKTFSTEDGMNKYLLQAIGENHARS